MNYRFLFTMVCPSHLYSGTDRSVSKFRVRTWPCVTFSIPAPKQRMFCTLPISSSEALSKLSPRTNLRASRIYCYSEITLSLALIEQVSSTTWHRCTVRQPRSLCRPIKFRRISPDHPSGHTRHAINHYRIADRKLRANTQSLRPSLHQIS